MSKIDVLREQLSLFDEAYEKGNPLISDTEYEKKYSELQKLEEKAGDVSQTSPTQTIAYIKVDGLETVKHTIPVLSLEKANDFETLLKWYQQAEDLVLVQPKLDGLTIVLRYKHGQLVDAITRGNGVEGERVLHTISTIKDLPHKIDFMGSLEIRGECYIPNDEFEKINNGQYSNPRAMAAGMVRRHDASLAQGLTITIFDLISAEGLEFSSNNKQIDFLRTQGFPVVKTTVHNAFCTIKNQCSEYQDIRMTLGYPIDGLVLKFNLLKTCKSLGVRSKSPRYAIAYKFDSLEEFTTLREIVWQVGKTGQITPVAIFDPIEIDGVTINRATLHNKKFIFDNDIRIGDKIVVARANDVIPQVIRAVVEARTEELPKTELPPKCPSCGEDYWKYSKDPNIACLNPFCKEQLIWKIIHFCSRDAMDIDEMGEVNVRSLFNCGLIRNPADLYDLHKKVKEIEVLEGFGKTRTKKILDGIEKSKDLPFSRLLYALVIPGIGRTSSKKLVKKFPTMEKIQNASREQLETVDGVGEITSQGIWFYFINPVNLKMIERITDAGVNTEEIVVEAGETLEGKTFVLTGTMSLPRAEIEGLIRVNAGKVSGSVSSKTSFLVAAPGETGTGKYLKAQQLGVPIISESQLMDMLS